METGAAANSSRDCGSWVASISERNSSGGSVPIMATFNGSEEAVSLKGFDGSICRWYGSRLYSLPRNAKGAAGGVRDGAHQVFGPREPLNYDSTSRHRRQAD